MNIADRSEATRMGWETRRKRQAREIQRAIDLEVLTEGARMIRVWSMFRLKHRTALKNFNGKALGHDSPPQTVILRVRRPFTALPLPEDYLTVETAREAAGFGSERGARLLSKYGTTVHAFMGDKILVQIRAFQDNLGSM